MSAVDRGILAALRQARIAQMLEAEGEALSAPIIGGQVSASDLAGRTYSTLPDPRLRAVAKDYARQIGMDYMPPPAWAKVNPDDALQYARAYDAMPDTPGDPLVQASWGKMGQETLDQLDALVQAGYKFEFMPKGADGEFLDPYKASPRLALEDLRDNRHMFTFPTEGGYGTLSQASERNPLLAPGPDLGKGAFGGQPYVLNDAFRAVHDALGHGPMGAGFRAGGEENAFRHHASLYSDLARPAVTAETRGQNSFVNFSDRIADEGLDPGDPRRGMTIAQANKGASGLDTIYADQKSGLMPDFVYNRGLEWMGRPVSVAQLRAIVAKGGASGALAALILKGAEVDERTQTIRLPADMAVKDMAA